MKYIYITLITLSIGFNTNVVNAQEEIKETINIPLSNPSSPGKLIVDLHRGGVEVVAYSGSEIVVTMIAQESEEKENSSNTRGLKRIPNSILDVEISEGDNVVKVDGGNKTRVDFVIQVPRNMSLMISTHHDGDVKVTGVSGEIEINGHHGGIVLEDVGGSVVADTHHGQIKASFTSVDNSKPMAFTTYHGDVDITFPGSITCETRIKTSKGDVYTDFEMNMQPVKINNKVNSKGKTKIKIGDWMHGNIGSGGQEYMFSTYHGDVIIRKG